MGCQKTKCNTCQDTYKACQLVNGQCSTCRAKKEPEQALKSQSTQIVNQQTEIASTNDVYYN